ncbi:hypothetical protein F5Y03DRAFT_407760 [Xylaria venustula]|nr:hypothetical protein F5Y03DRAFT_407760 [Xylaria venustula]
MANQPGNWREQYGQPYRKRKNLECHSGHTHATNTPAAGLVLVRLNADSQMELLLDLRSMAVPYGGTFGFIGGLASTIGEAPLATAMREVQEEYHIDPSEIKPTGHKLRRDHGGPKYLHYTYVFAEYNPKNGQAPAPRPTGESTRSEWFPLESLPNNLIKFIVEDIKQIKDILYADVLPKLRGAQNMQQEAMSSHKVDDDGDIAMGDAPSEQNAANGAPTSNPASIDKTGEVNNPELPDFIPGNNGNSKPANDLGNPTAPSNGQVHYPTLPTADGSKNNTSAMPGPNGPSVQVQYPALPTPSPSSQKDEDKTKAAEKKPKADKTTQAPRGSIFSKLFRSPFKTPSKPNTTPVANKQTDKGEVQQDVQSKAKQDDQSKTKQNEENKATLNGQGKVVQNGQNKAKNNQSKVELTVQDKVVENDQNKAKQNNQSKAKPTDQSKAQQKNQGKTQQKVQDKETKQKDQVNQGATASWSGFVPAFMKPAEPKPNMSGLFIPKPKVPPSAGFIPGTFQHQTVGKLMEVPSSLNQVPPPFVPPPSEPQSNPTIKEDDPPVSLWSIPPAPTNKRKDVHEPMPTSATSNKRSQLSQPTSNNARNTIARKTFVPSQIDNRVPQYAANAARRPNPPVVRVNRVPNSPGSDFGFF